MFLYNNKHIRLISIKHHCRWRVLWMWRNRWLSN